MKFEQLQQLVKVWADNKDLLVAGNVSKQFLKVIEEVGELSSGIAKNDMPEIEDAMGDTLVTLIILSEQLGIDPVICLAKAYAVISKRTGKTIDGVFVKDSE